MSAGVHTPELRFRFVEKSLSEVGDGKPFPMEVTGSSVAEKLDKIAEIFYRVKDAEFTQGYIDFYFNETSHQTLIAPTTLPSNRSYSAGLGDSYIFRGYTTYTTGEFSEEISAYNLNYLDDEYDRGDGDYWRDISNNERGMWIAGERNESQEPVILPLWNDYEHSGTESTTAFSIYCFTEAFSTSGEFFLAQDWIEDDPIPQPGGADVEVAFNGQIAIVRESPSDGFWKPTNKFYIGLHFTSADVGYLPPFSTNEAFVSGSLDTPCNYVIRLSSGDLSCPIYADTTYATLTGADFIHEATEWWPYAKDSPAVPVWDTSTGAKL